MPIARERIVPRLPGNGWQIAWRFAALGLALGTTFGALIPSRILACMNGAALAGPVASVCLVASAIGLLVIALAPVPLLLRVTQRWSALLGFAAAYSASVLLGAHTLEVLNLSDGGANPAEWIDWQPDLRLAIAAGAYLILSIILWPVFRIFLARAIEHRSGDCTWCGYTRGAESISTCPECGRSPMPPRFRFHAQVMTVAWLARRAGLTLAATLAALTVAAQWPLWTRTIPCARLYSHFPTGVPVATDWRPGPFQARTLESSAEVWVPESIPSARGLYIARYVAAHGPRATRSSIVVSIGAAPTQSPVGLFPTFGWPPITATLDSAQADWVLAHGLPPALVHAMQTEADAAGWNPKSYVIGDVRVQPKPEWFPK